MFGDPNQLEPLCLAAKASEVVENTRISPLGLLIEKGFPHEILDMQYRMCPAISMFVSQHFYRGALQNAPSTKQDNPWRNAMCEVSKQHYGINGPEGKGSEYWFVDVMRGAARVQGQGTSLQNFANADAICLAVKRLRVTGMPPEDIVILTLYKAQKAIILSKLDEVSGDTWKIGDVHTVDVFQGKESPVVLLDLVIASSKASIDDEDESTSYGRVSVYARDPHGLNVEIT